MKKLKLETCNYNKLAIEKRRENRIFSFEWLDPITLFVHEQDSLEQIKKDCLESSDLISAIKMLRNQKRVYSVSEEETDTLSDEGEHLELSSIKILKNMVKVITMDFGELEQTTEQATLLCKIFTEKSCLFENNNVKLEALAEFYNSANNGNFEKKQVIVKAYAKEGAYDHPPMEEFFAIIISKYSFKNNLEIMARYLTRDFSIFFENNEENAKIKEKFKKSTDENLTLTEKRVILSDGVNSSERITLSIKEKVLLFSKVLGELYSARKI